MIRWHRVRTVATFELMSAVKRTGFLVVTFGMPLFVAAYGVNAPRSRPTASSIAPSS
jgi:hypothetical protein